MPREKKSIIATDTPEKDAIVATKMKKVAKRDVKRIKRKIVDASSESEDEVFIAKDSSDDDEIFADPGEDNEDDVKKLNLGDYAIIKVHRKKLQDSRHFIAKITEKFLTGYEVQFYKRHFPSYRFKETNEVCSVPFEDLRTKLP